MRLHQKKNYLGKHESIEYNNNNNNNNNNNSDDNNNK